MSVDQISPQRRGQPDLHINCMDSNIIQLNLILPGTVRVEMAEVIRQNLHLITSEVTIIPEHMIVTGMGSTLDPFVTVIWGHVKNVFNMAGNIPLPLLLPLPILLTCILLCPPL